MVNSTETRQMDHVDYPKDYTFGRISIFIISQIMEILPRNQEIVFYKTDPSDETSIRAI